jgi:hypothetical protein
LRGLGDELDQAVHPVRCRTIRARPLSYLAGLGDGIGSPALAWRAGVRIVLGHLPIVVALDRHGYLEIAGSNRASRVSVSMGPITLLRHRPRHTADDGRRGHSATVHDVTVGQRAGGFTLCPMASAFRASRRSVASPRLERAGSPPRRRSRRMASMTPVRPAR